MHGLMEEKNHPIFPGDRKFSNDIYAYPFFFSILINSNFPHAKYPKFFENCISQVTRIIKPLAIVSA